MLSFPPLFALVFTALLSIGSARPHEKRTQQFNIYAFGDHISGLQVYYSDGAYLFSLTDPSSLLWITTYKQYPRRRCDR